MPLHSTAMYIYEKCHDVDTIKFVTQYESQVAGVHIKNIQIWI